MTALLSITDVDGFYGGAQILDGVSLQIDSKESVALIGRNGVGKTTVVNAILGLASVRRGSISFCGKTPKPLRPYHAATHGLAIVPQGRRIFPTLTVREQLVLGSAPNRKGLWTLDAVFDLFPMLRERSESSGSAMSGGQQQMLAIGRALMSNPQLLILDEPTEGLAPLIVEELAQTLRRVFELGTSVLLIEQNLNFVFKTTERFLVMSKGTIIRSGRTADVRPGDLHEYITV